MKNILFSLLAVLLLSGCSVFGKETQRETFDYSKSPCACADQGFYFNGKFYKQTSV